jgi:hypothetical protein
MLRMRMTTRKKSYLSGTQLDDECVSLMFDMCVCSFLSRNICADHHTLAAKVKLEDGRVSNGSGVSGHSTISESLVVSRPISRRNPAFLGPSKINTARDTKHFPCRTVPTRTLIILFHLEFYLVSCTLYTAIPRSGWIQPHGKFNKVWSTYRLDINADYLTDLGAFANVG